MKATVTRSISRFEFDQLLPMRAVLEGFTGRLIDWYAAAGDKVIGAVDQARTGHRWSYVVLKQDRDGTFRVAELKAELESREAAKAALLRAMAGTEAKS